METHIMRTLTLSLAATIAMAANTHTVAADEVADQMVQDALPLMYHTCDSVVDETDGDEAKIVDVVGKMVALVFINRNIDIAQHAKTDEERATVRGDFIGAYARVQMRIMWRRLKGLPNNLKMTSMATATVIDMLWEVRRARVPPGVETYFVQQNQL